MKQRIASYRCVLVAGDGSEVVDQADGVLRVETVRKSGLDQAISAALAPCRRLRAVHDPGKIPVAIRAAQAEARGPAAVALPERDGRHSFDEIPVTVPTRSSTDLAAGKLVAVLGGDRPSPALSTRRCSTAGKIAEDHIHARPDRAHPPMSLNTGD